MTHNKTKYILYGVLFLYFITGAITLVISPQRMIWDAGLCIKMTDNASKHIPFNHYSHPKPGNLNEDESEFVAWWSPGQFAMPLLIQKCFGVKISVAIKILTMICMLISGLGIFQLFKQLIPNKSNGDNDNSSLTMSVFWLLIFTLMQPFFWGNLFVYDGGGILMFAYCPWFIYWVIKYIRVNIYGLLILLVLAIAGFFLKTSFTSIFTGALCFLFLSNSVLPGNTLKKPDFKKLILNAIYLSLVFIIYILITKTFFLNYNTNISDSSLGIRLQPRVFAFPIIAPLFGLFSLDFLNKSLYWIIGCVVVLPVYYFILKSDRLNLLYKYVLISFITISILFYSLLYLLNLDVSYELRHYQILTILLTPAFFLIFQKSGLAKYFVGVLIILYSVKNTVDYVNDLSGSSQYQSSNTYSRLPSEYPNNLIEKIHSLDNLKHNGKDIFYFKSDEPSIALEIRNNRVLLEDNFINFHFNNQARLNPTLYYGRNAGELYIVYPLHQFKQDSLTYLTRFDRYKKFEKIYQTMGYAIFKGIDFGNNKLKKK